MELQPKPLLEVADKLGELDWILPGLIQVGGLILVDAPTGTGKTQLVLQLASDLALGRQFLAEWQPPRQFRTLYMNLEMTEGEAAVFIAAQTSRLSEEQKATLNDNVSMVATGYPLYLTDKEVRNFYLEQLSSGEYDLLVLDTLTNSVSSDMKEETTARDVMHFLSRVRTEFKCAVLVVHHLHHVRGQKAGTGRSEDTYGSKILVNATNTHLRLEPYNEDQYMFSIPKNRLGPSNVKLVLERTTELRFEVTDELTSNHSNHSNHTTTPTVKVKVKGQGPATPNLFLLGQ